MTDSVPQTYCLQCLDGSLSPTIGHPRVPHGKLYIRQGSLAAEQVERLKHESHHLIADLRQLIVA